MSQSRPPAHPYRVTIIGAGNWGTAFGRLCAQNVLANPAFFHNTVLMWVVESDFYEGRKLSEIINETHENPKYLPGIRLPHNIHVTTDAAEIMEKGDLHVFVLPHQFCESFCDSFDHSRMNKKAKMINLAKGLAKGPKGQPLVLSQVLTSRTGLPCAALGGAHVAREVAQGKFTEATLAYNTPDEAFIWHKLINQPMFPVVPVPDLNGVQVCGALKNVVALAAGFADGLDLGVNGKSSIIRMGISEMRKYASIFFDGVLDQTFLDSAGIADIIATCFGGRNVKCAAEFVRRRGHSSWEELETEMLGGQKLQGYISAIDVFETIETFQLHQFFPLFVSVFEIATGKLEPTDLLPRCTISKILPSCAEEVHIQNGHPTTSQDSAAMTEEPWLVQGRQNVIKRLGRVPL